MPPLRGGLLALLMLLLRLCDAYHTPHRPALHRRPPLVIRGSGSSGSDEKDAAAAALAAALAADVTADAVADPNRPNPDMNGAGGAGDGRAASEDGGCEASGRAGCDCDFPSLTQVADSLTCGMITGL